MENLDLYICYSFWNIIKYKLNWAPYSKVQQVLDLERSKMSSQHFETFIRRLLAGLEVCTANNHHVLKSGRDRTACMHSGRNTPKYLHSIWGSIRSLIFIYKYSYLWITGNPPLKGLTVIWAQRTEMHPNLIFNVNFLS